MPGPRLLRQPCPGRFRTEAWQKEYLALIHGRPMGPEGWEDLLWKDKEKKSCLCGPAHAQRVKAAKLAYRTLEAREI